MKNAEEPEQPWEWNTNTLGIGIGTTLFYIMNFTPQSVVRFLWDAHNCEDSPADAEMQLGVSFAYVERWSDDLEQLWFLGMQILNSLMRPVSEGKVDNILYYPWF